MTPTDGYVPFGSTVLPLSFPAGPPTVVEAALVDDLPQELDGRLGAPDPRGVVYHEWMLGAQTRPN